MYLSFGTDASVLLCGDFNARIGLADSLRSDLFAESDVMYEWEDKNLNGRGKQLRNFAIGYNWQLHNGYFGHNMFTF